MRHLVHHVHRLWWAPWIRRCSCGRPPHPPEPPVVDGPIDDGTYATWAVKRMRSGDPTWNGPTVATPTIRPGPPDRPLLTPGQRARSGNPGRWRRP